LSFSEVNPAKGVLITGEHSPYRDKLDLYYQFPQRWLNAARRIVGEWFLYLEPRRAGGRGYFAVAKLEQLIRDPMDDGMYLGLVEPGSYFEFGRDVAFRLDGRAVERGLLNEDGRLNNGRAIQSIRPITDNDFYRIVDLGLVDENDHFPREDILGENDSEFALREEQMPWEGPRRETILVERKVRNRQFRKRVIEAYECRCALTGMKLINGGGRAEVQAAHIQSVEFDGPDRVANGIALSGTIHWMFDRGLISLRDNGDILLSRKINDIKSVERLLAADRKARLPANENHRPHPRYLAWHREWHGFAA
jgi:putative restriction endonuclease